MIFGTLQTILFILLPFIYFLNKEVKGGIYTFLKYWYNDTNENIFKEKNLIYVHHCIHHDEFYNVTKALPLLAMITIAAAWSYMTAFHKIIMV